MFISFSGLDALVVASDANLQPELLTGVQWLPARSLVQARAMACDDPNSVRLRADPRILLENILHRAIEPDTDLMALVQASMDGGAPVPPSFPLIQAKLP